MSDSSNDDVPFVDSDTDSPLDTDMDDNLTDSADADQQAAENGEVGEDLPPSPDAV